MTDKNVVSLAASASPNELARALAHMREALPMLVEHERMRAKLVRESFLALKAAGFTDAQALEIAKAR